MKTIAVGTLKGGAGKSTVLFNIAGVLAETHKVLLIDVDPQCNLSSACGVKKSLDWRRLIRKLPYTVGASSRDIFDPSSDKTPEELVQKHPIEALPNLDVIPGNILMTAVEFTMVNRSAREWVLSNYIQDNREFFEQYDYVLIDTNPSVGIINQNAFVASESIIMTTDVGEDGIEGAGMFLYLWGGICNALRKKPNVEALIITRADRRIGLTEELYEFCQEDDFFSKLLVKNMIYEKVIYKEARMSHLPVNVIPGGEKAEADVRAVVNELFERGVF